MEAFSDGVVAILITIMVLELKVPHGIDLSSLKPLIPVFISYVLSFVFLGIYWNNHHHLLHATKTVDGSILWANLHLLFWLSLIPFTTAWTGEHSFAPWPVALYGIVLFFTGLAYYLLTRVIIRRHGRESVVGRAIGADRKGILSLLIYVGAIPFSFINSWVSYAMYALVAAMWLIPDRRIEAVVE
jgi:uncharacterized membrane protein